MKYYIFATVQFHFKDQLTINVFQPALSRPAQINSYTQFYRTFHKWFSVITKKLPIKDVRIKGGGLGVAQCRHFVDKGERFFKCGRPHFLVQKTSDYARTRGEGVNFSRFCMDVLIDGL